MSPAAADPVRITDVELFRIELPCDDELREAGAVTTYTVARVATDVGVRGISFAAPPVERLPEARRLLVGRDLFDVEALHEDGLYRFLGLEHALWDAIGKICEQPVHRLLGGGTTEIDAYLTSVWPGPADQAHVPFSEQAAWGVKVKDAGYRGMKVRAWRPDPIEDVEACRVIREAVGDDFCIMVDRTAHLSGHVWDHDTALEMAAGLQSHGVLWLEEPLARYDFRGVADLCRRTDIAISGGEGYTGVEPFRICAEHGAYDIWQPDTEIAGGILPTLGAGTLAKAWGKSCVLHGNLGLKQAAWLQAASVLHTPWYELVYVNPPLWPEEHWSPGTHVLNTDRVFDIVDGKILVPQNPGLGLDVNEEALEAYRLSA